VDRGNTEQIDFRTVQGEEQGKGIVVALRTGVKANMATRGYGQGRNQATVCAACGRSDGAQQGAQTTQQAGYRQNVEVVARTGLVDTDNEKRDPTRRPRSLEVLLLLHVRLDDLEVVAVEDAGARSSV
jgi:hypothetical protein